ncbi:MAG: hypothetical protein ACYC9S_00505 [Leptospirales bacterium]
MKKKLRLIAMLLLLAGVVPAGGPIYLGIVRDDVHAHSAIGDYGLQAITASGILIIVLGLFLLGLSRTTEPSR